MALKECVIYLMRAVHCGAVSRAQTFSNSSIKCRIFECKNSLSCIGQADLHQKRAGKEETEEREEAGDHGSSNPRLAGTPAGGNVLHQKHDQVLVSH